MHSQSKMNFAPDGLNSGFSARTMQGSAIPAMFHDYDDGLVHGHRFTDMAEPASSYTIVTKPSTRQPVDHSHDDGLVHAHGWAVSSPER